MTDFDRHFLFSTWEGAGLVTAELAVASHLIERGHRVTVLADPPIAEDARAIGAAFRPWELAPARATRDPGDDLVADWETRSPFELMRRMREQFVVGPAHLHAADVATAIDELAPDAVVSDTLLLGAHVAAEARRIPSAAVIPNIYMFPAAGSPPFGTGWLPPSTVAARWRHSLVDRLTSSLWDKGLPRLNSLRRDHGLVPLQSLWAQLDQLDRVLVLTATHFDFPGALASNVRYVGPQLDDPAWSEVAWHRPPRDKPLVLAALSSGFQDQRATLERILAALETLDVRAVVTTGRAVDPRGLSSSEQVEVVPWAPHTKVMEEAAAVVTHGGHGTVLKALAAGIPVVCLPMGRDQPDNAARLSHLGAGVRLPVRARPDKIAAAVEQVIEEPRYRLASQTVAACLARYRTRPSQAVHELESLVGRPTGREGVI